MIKIIFIHLLSIILKELFKIIKKIIIKKNIYSIIFNGSIIVHKNTKSKEPFFIYMKIRYKNKELDYKKFMKIIKNYLNNKKEDSDNNILNFYNYLKEVEERIKSEFKHNYFFIIINKFEKKDERNDNNDNLYNITSKMTLYTPFNKKQYKYNIDNILVDGTNSKSCGFEFLINDLNEYYKKIDEENIPKNHKKEIIYDMKGLNSKTNNDTSLAKASTQTTSLLYEKKNPYKILKYIERFEDYTKSEKYEEELKNGIYFGEYDSEIIKKYIKAKISLGANDCKYIEIIKQKILSITQIDFSKNRLNDIILMNENTSIICCEKGTYICYNLFGKPFFKTEMIPLSKISYIGGIKINENIVALTSNKILSNGKDQLLFFDIKNKNVISIKEGYSFLISQNNSSLINIVEKNIRVFLFACKKYNKTQKNGNGILLSIQNSDFPIYKFYNTEKFEVHCFCQISKKINKDIITNSEYINTEYFFVGGFDVEKKKGLIKLYKINFKGKIDTIEIEYIQDVIFEKNENFKGPITSITQSRINGNILVTCLNRNGFLFHIPNIDWFLNLKENYNFNVDKKED